MEWGWGWTSLKPVVQPLRAQPVRSIADISLTAPSPTGVGVLATGNVRTLEIQPVATEFNG